MRNRFVRLLLATAGLAAVLVVIPGIGDDPHGVVASAADQRTYTGGRF